VRFERLWLDRVAVAIAAPGRHSQSASHAQHCCCGSGVAVFGGGGSGAVVVVVWRGGGRWNRAERGFRTVPLPLCGWL
jgi:hypothetical protein